MHTKHRWPTARKAAAAMALGLLVSLSAVTNSNSQDQNWQQEDAKIQMCHAFGATVAADGIIQDAIAAKAAGVDKETELEHVTEHIKNLGSEAISAPPKDAVAYANLIIGAVWFPNTNDIPHEAETSVIDFCQW